MTKSNQPGYTSYMPQLDALRTVAVGLVITQHWFQVLLPPFIKPGLTGVHIFFILSGFLITGILLRMRDGMTQSQNSAFSAFKIYYVRRSIRIFPLYYFIVLCCIVIGVSNFREEWFVYLFYLANFLNPPFLGGHLWTLAVEEQFYLIWPLVILFMPKKYIPYVMFSIILFALFFRELVWEFDMGTNWGRSILSNMHTLALGAMFAYIRHENIWKIEDNAILRKQITVGLLLSLVIGFAFRYGIFNKYITNVPLIFMGDIFISLGLLFPVFSLAYGVKGKLGTILTNRTICYFGTISYGMYIYHPFVRESIVSIFHVWNLQPIDIMKPLVFSVLCLVVLIPICMLSWHFFEKPINNLKRNYIFKTITD